MSRYTILISRFFLLFLCGFSLAEGQEPAAGGKANQRLLEELKSSPYEILHEAYAGDNWEIFLRRADGSEPRNLTRTPDVHEMYPRSSPDGSRICFVADELAGGKTVRSVCYIRRDGSGRTLVAKNGRQPCWSPDGKTIAYLKGEFPVFNVMDFATKGLFFYDLATGQHREHPNKKIHHLYNICWSANGRWILATVHGGMGYSHAILALEANGDGAHNLKIGGCRPDLGPGDRMLVWGKDDHTLAVADIDLESSVPKLSNLRDVVKDKLHVYHADWSPDGKYIVFSRGPGGRMPPKGPGTHRGIAELVGVRAPWDLCVADASGKGGWLQLTSDGESNKEADWIVPQRARAAGAGR